MSPKAVPATRQDTIEALLKRSRRTSTPVRVSFMQQRHGGTRLAGPLATLVTNGDARALDLYLLAHAAASAEPFDIVLPAATWGRALGLDPTQSTASAVSRAMGRLADLRLISRTRAGNRAKLLLLNESGNGEPYTHPSKMHEPYLKLPHHYWTDGWHARLSMPAKAVLLIGLSLRNEFILPIERSPAWYAISADTVHRGLKELLSVNLLRVMIGYKKAPLAPKGFTEERRYTLLPPFWAARRDPVRAPSVELVGDT